MKIKSEIGGILKFRLTQEDKSGQLFKLTVFGDENILDLWMNKEEVEQLKRVLKK